MSDNIYRLAADAQGSADELRAYVESLGISVDDDGYINVADDPYDPSN